MKIILSILLFISTSIFAQESVYVSEDGNYSVVFPGVPEQTQSIEKTDAGDITLNMSMYEKSATQVYFVSYNDYPSALVEQSDDKTMLTGGIEGARKSINCDVTEFERFSKIKGYQAIETKGRSTESNYYFYMYSVMRKNRLYQVFILQEGKYPTDKEIKDFKGSFKLLESGNSQQNTLKENSKDSNASFSSEDGRYSIIFPGEPKGIDQVQDTEAGEILLHMDMYEKSATEVFMVGYNDYPSDLEINIEDAMNGAKNAMNLDVDDYLKAGEKNGNPTLEFKARSTNSNYHVHYYLVIDGQRMYQVAMLRDGSYPTRKEVDEFIGSFKINKK